MANTESIDGKRCDTFEEAIVHGPGGPGGPGVWGWSGDEENPTIHPSIHCLDQSQWHGFLKCGRFASC
jgi:hypothetical protein